MNLDKGFHSGSVAWQIHDHEVDELVKHNRQVTAWYREFIGWCRDGIGTAIISRREI